MNEKPFNCIRIMGYKKENNYIVTLLFCFSDPHGARTHDPNIKSVVLYQLS